jgi:hypothetical protein
MSATYSNQSQVVQGFVAVVEAVLEPLVANLPSVVAANQENLEVVQYLVVVAASGPADFVATVVYPFQAVESAWVASGLVAVVDYFQRPSKALMVECLAA